MNRLTLFILLLAIAMSACNKPSGESEEQEQDTVTTAESTRPQLEKIWETDTILTTNESVLYASDGQVLYVSNIAGEPTGKDGVGFISKLDPQGEVKILEWVSGLNAPKGMAILDGKLYVTDIDELVEINLADSSISNRYSVQGAQFLNDVATNGEDVYFSDMKTGTIHVLTEGAVSVFADSVESINGLAFGSDGALYGLDKSGLHKFSEQEDDSEVINSVVTDGDGLVVLDQNTFIASRWKGEIYLIKDGKEYLLLDTKDQDLNTADIGYVPDEQLVLVPTFSANKVVAYQLSY